MKPLPPMARNAACQPHVAASAAIGPIIIAPTFVPVLKMPVAKARWRLGNHSATALTHAGKFAAQGLDVGFVQDNHSRSRRGTLRGLHVQLPRSQGKLVRCVEGAIFDVAVDIRRGSPHFGRWVGVRLSGANRLQIYIPRGFAHGFLVLSDEADFLYKCDAFYSGEDDCGLAWDDPQIGIEWPLDGAPILSEKDRRNPTLATVDPGRLPQ